MTPEIPLEACTNKAEFPESGRPSRTGASELQKTSLAAHPAMSLEETQMQPVIAQKHMLLSLTKQQLPSNCGLRMVLWPCRKCP
jgi:hypothetical protein